MDRALIVRKKWLDKILDDGKCWEMRSRRTNITGWIGLIEAGTGLIVGKAFLLSGHMRPTLEELRDNIDKHQVKETLLLNKWCYVWELGQAERLTPPIKYNHPKGAVTWVKLNETNQARQ